jgi:hypothetical protein
MRRAGLLVVLGVVGFSVGLIGGRGATLRRSIAEARWQGPRVETPRPDPAPQVPGQERPRAALPPAPAAALPAPPAASLAASQAAVSSATPPGIASAAPAASWSIGSQPPEPGEVADDDAQPDPPSGPQLVATYKEAWVYAAPSFKARKLGYLQAGASVGRSDRPVTRAGCEGGWYRVLPKGFVCVGGAASLDLDHPVAPLATRRPDRKSGLPYPYAMSKYPTPPLYLKLPSEAEQRSVEPDAAERRKIDPALAASLDAPPPSLLHGEIIPSLTPNHHGPGALYSGRAVPRSGFAMLSQFAWEGRAWGLTTDFQIIPLDRMRTITPSSFHGLELRESGLPAVFVRSKSHHFLRRDGAGALKDDGAVAFREGVAIKESSGLAGHVESRDGRFVPDSSLVRVDAPREWPGFAVEGRRWIDVSILRQTLVAYEGQKPVYATLVSTGADGLGDPEKTHSTVRGVFLIHTKHVTVTMDSDEVTDRFDLRDVPYVQYFEKGYALHAAYWHDDFGKPRSHGCVNLHPTDAAWLFAWTDPQVPEGWHGAMTLKTGTIVYIHP